jgi:hypothetical protein
MDTLDCPVRPVRPVGPVHLDTCDRPVACAWAHAAPAATAAAAPAGASDVQVVRLPDGATVGLRAASTTGEDDAGLRRPFFTLSDSTRYLYFCAGVPATPTWAERFVALASPRSPDRDQSHVLVAEVGSELVGFARFSSGSGTQSHVRDLDIVLTDASQGRGLGGYLLCRLATEARAA